MNIKETDWEQDIVRELSYLKYLKNIHNVMEDIPSQSIITRGLCDSSACPMVIVSICIPNIKERTW